MAHEPGTFIGPNLRLVRLLAKGGMGSVWVADHLGLHTQVAVKFIADDAAEDPMIKARFEREALAAAQLRSPHVVQIFDHGRTESGASYIAMELLDGETLGKRLMRLGALNARETVVIVGQVCRALSKAHAAGIVHRDIKPDNIFIIDSDGELFVKVLDFGIAKGATDQPLNVTSTGMAVGTPLYMSPEQSVSAKDVTFSTDLWAIAAVAYRCLVGQVPFKGSSFGALCLAINRGQFPPPTTLRPDLAPALDAWFARALALSTADRFASAREFSAQFSRAAGFSSGILISVPSGLPVRSTTGQQAAQRLRSHRARPCAEERRSAAAPCARPRAARTPTALRCDRHRLPLGLPRVGGRRGGRDGDTDRRRDGEWSMGRGRPRTGTFAMGRCDEVRRDRRAHRVGRLRRALHRSSAARSGPRECGSRARRRSAGVCGDAPGIGGTG
jgi:serine/threonine protein kinase